MSALRENLAPTHTDSAKFGAPPLSRLDDNLHVVAQRDREAHQPFDRIAAKLAGQHSRHLWLVDTHEFGGQFEQKVGSEVVLQSEQMSNTITVRLPEDLAGWLEAASRKAGVPRGRIIREQLELARQRHDQPFLHLAGSVDGPRDLSARKGFAKK